MTSGRHGTSEAWLGDASPSLLVGRSGRSCTWPLKGGKGRMPLYTRTYQSEGVRLAPVLPPLADLPPIPCMLLTG